MSKQEYIDHLRANGASDEDIKTLTEGAGAAASIRAFDAMQARLASEATARAAAEKAKTDYDTWFQNDLTPKWNELQANATKATGNEARAVAILRDLNRQGLVENALLEGIVTPTPGAPSNIPGTPGNPTPPARNVADPAFDPNKYLTRDEIMSIARQEGKAIAVMAKMSAEHAQLFPGSDPVDWPTLHDQAIAAKKSVEQVWQETYKIPEARAARSKAAADAHDAAIAKAERKKVVAEFVAKYGANPDTRVPMPSRSPFVVRPERAAGGAAPKQPWESSESELSARRVENATRKSLERTA